MDKCDRYSRWMLIMPCLVFVLFSLVKAELTDKDFRCRRTLPSEGVYMQEPPYFIPKYCPTPHRFDEASSQRCLKNRTVYVMGNSIARQFLFNTVEILGGEAVDREDQKRYCPKIETNWDSNSCHKEYKDVRFKFLFFRYMDGFFYKDRGGFPFLTKVDTYNTAPNKLPLHPNDVTPPANHILADNCIHEDTKTCLKNFFHDAKKDDILLFSLGFGYCEQASDSIDYEAWLRASASAFRSNLQEVFPGVVFRINNPQVHSFRNFPHIDACLRKVDRHLWEIWHPSTFPEDRAWYHIDQYNINKGRPALYNDGLHFIGNLSRATIQQVLNQLCPEEGVPITVKPALDLKLSLVKIKESAETKTIENMYLVDEFGAFWKLPQPVGLCPNVLKYERVINMTTKQFQALNPVVLPFPEICANETLVRIGSNREIYGLYAEGMQMFNSFAAFASRGYDFGHVKTLSEREFNYFKTGPTIMT